jgi:hypothetical protein
VNPKQAIAWVKKRGITVESATTTVPSFAEMVAGEPLRGSWWAHPKGKDIFRLSRVVRDSPDVLVCRLVDGKITYVHRRLWPALVALAARFSKPRLAAIKEVHTPAGEHKLLIVPFPVWVPGEVLRASRKLAEKAAAARLEHIITFPEQ